MIDLHDRPLPAEIHSVAEAYLQGADRLLPRRAVGCYLVGSITLEDYHPDRSDVDFVSVFESPPDSSELTRLTEVHRVVARKDR